MSIKVRFRLIFVNLFNFNVPTNIQINTKLIFRIDKYDKVIKKFTSIEDVFENRIKKDKDNEVKQVKRKLI